MRKINDYASKNTFFVKEIQRGNNKIYKEFLDYNSKLIQKVANQYYHSYGHLVLLDVEELKLEAQWALIQAAQNFSFSKDVNFSTYAMYHFKNNITKNILSNTTIRIPDNKFWELIKNKEMDKQVYARVLSLDKPFNSEESDSATLLESIEDTKNVSIEDSVIEKNRMEQLRTLLNKLPKRNRDIIVQRYGLDHQGERTLAEIGLQYNLTRERIRQIEEQSIKKLKFYSRKM